VAVLGDEYLVLDADPDAAEPPRCTLVQDRQRRDVHSGLDRDHLHSHAAFASSAGDGGSSEDWPPDNGVI
jgi:hypothetical protein